MYYRGHDPEKSPLTYQFLTFGISPRNMTYQRGIWHISVVWHISQDFDISVRILYRLPLQYKPFCTVFHCSTNPFVPSSTAVQKNIFLFLPFIQSLASTTRPVVPPVSVLPHALLSSLSRALHPLGDAASVMSPLFSHRDARRPPRIPMRDAPAASDPAQHARTVNLHR